MFHPSLLVLHTHFDITFLSIFHLLAELSRPKSTGHAQLRTCIEEFGFLAKSDANTGYERGLLIFSTRTWNTRVYSTDSSLSGWGITHTDWSKDVVGRTGRASERRRLNFGGPGARKSAMAASRLVLDDDRWTVEGVGDSDEETGFDFDPSFEEVPFEWLERCRWNVCCCGRWNRCRKQEPG